MSERLAPLLQQIQQCQLCASKLPAGPRPVVQASEQAPILIAGQAPGRKVHATGIPFNDPSGDRLRQWLGVDRETFYNPACFALVPMGFCYPGTGQQGDLPPRPECAATWRQHLMARLTGVKLTLAIGQYAINWHINQSYPTLTATVADWQRWWPTQLPLPHPSPRNNRWLARNPWFAEDIIPQLQERVRELL